MEQKLFRGRACDSRVSPSLASAAALRELRADMILRPTGDRRAHGPMGPRLIVSGDLSRFVREARSSVCARPQQPPSYPANRTCSVKNSYDTVNAY